MHVVAKISYLERNVVTLKLPKEYLNTVTRNKPVLFWIRTEQCDLFYRSKSSVVKGA